MNRVKGVPVKKNMCPFYRYRFFKMDLGKSFEFSASSLGSGLSGTNSQADPGKRTQAVLLCTGTAMQVHCQAGTLQRARA